MNKKNHATSLRWSIKSLLECLIKTIYKNLKNQTASKNEAKTEKNDIFVDEKQRFEHTDHKRVKKIKT